MKQNLINRVLSVGNNDANSLEFNARLQVLNTFIILSFCFAIPFEIGMIINEYWSSALLFFAIQIWLLICLYLNFKRKYETFKIALYLVIALALPSLGFSLGNQSGFYLYFFLFPLIAFNLYTFKETKNLIRVWLVLLVSLVLTLQLNHMPSYPLIKLEPEFKDTLFHFNFFLCLIFLITMMYNIVSSHNKLYQKLENTLKEKDILLAEVHHRVKNNLSVISGLFRLQIKDTNLKEMNDFLLDNSNRIHSMGLTHNLLYLQKNISYLDFDNYIKELVNSLSSSFSGRDKISISYDLLPLKIDLNTAAPFGLIINEIITNSIKHAFPNLKDPKIQITLTEEAQNYKLIIKDNGPGFNLKENKTDNSIGLFIIDSLIDQIEGKYQFDNSSGACYSILFPKKNKTPL